MGYRTVQRIPSHVRTYERAKLIHDNSKPIRGNPNNVRPLGNRRDWQSYSVRMNGEAVEFVCYKTPVVTYYPDNSIEVRNGGWDTVSTRQFIMQTLDTPCHGQRRKTIVKLGGVPYVLPSDGLLKLKNEGGALVLNQGTPVLYGYKIDRKAANNVRAKYKEFYDYLKGFVALRATTSPSHYKHHPDFEVLHVSIGEVADMVGLKPAGGDHCVPNIDLYKGIEKRPPEINDHWRKRENYDAKYESSGKRFIDLISSSGEDAHTDHYKAAVLLCIYHRNVWIRNDDLANDRNKTLAVDVGAPMTLLDNIVMRWHADEVLVREPLPLGKLPNPKYENWFDKE